MLDHPLSFSRVRSTLLPAALSALLLVPLFTAGCGEACATCGVGGLGGEGGAGGATGTNNGGAGGGGGAACPSGQGTLEGIAYINSAPGMPDSAPGANATIVLLTSPEATPLYGMADDTGQFSIPLDAGQWLVGGEHPSNCQTPDLTAVQIEACETVQVELILNECFDG